jgi:ascorbate-specific PTS system EIIC-type component UlaA
VQIKSILLTVGIVTLVLAVRRIAQPWRGIIDLGVVLGLTWGIVSIAVFTYMAFATDGFDHSPETPTDA